MTHGLHGCNFSGCQPAGYLVRLGMPCNVAVLILRSRYTQMFLLDLTKNVKSIDLPYAA